MRKTCERLAFMVIGALLVSIAYFVGSADKTDAAEFTTFDNNVVIKGHLTLYGQLNVADPDSNNAVLINADETVAGMQIGYRLEGEDEPAASVIISTQKDGDTPYSVILLSDNSGNTIYMASDENGWLRK